MRVKQLINPKAFLDRVENFLMQKEAVNNLPLGILYSLVSREIPNQESGETFFALVEDNEHIVLVMVRSSSYLIVYGEGEKLSEAVDLAVRYVSNAEIIVPGVIGPANIAENFAEKWEDSHDVTVSVGMKQRIYALSEVNDVNLSEGHLRLANTNDVQLVQQWIYAFSAEAVSEQTSHEDALKMAKQGINNGNIYLWENGGPVSMANKTRPTKHGIGVNLVYTPPEFRNRGYATACVASLSRKLLVDGYRHCFLYTDLSNPTSNSIYIKIGYQPVEDSTLYLFEPCS